MCKKNLVLMIVLLAAFVAWSAPAVALASDDGIIELPNGDNDHPLPDPDDGLSADPQTFDVEVWSAPILEVTPDAGHAGFWSRFLAAFEEMMQRIWEIASPR